MGLVKLMTLGETAGLSSRSWLDDAYSGKLHAPSHAIAGLLREGYVSFSGISKSTGRWMTFAARMAVDAEGRLWEE